MDRKAVMKDLTYIYEIYKCGNISSAARNLYLSQPALSAALKRIEGEMGITIFDRSTTPLALTEEGRVYMEGVKDILSTERTIRRRLEDMSDLKSGKITVGGENFVSSFIMPPILMAFSHRYPGIDTEIVESNSPDLKNQLISESVDLLISHTFDKNLFTAEALFDEDLLLAVPKSMPINEKLTDYAIGTDIIREKKALRNAPAVNLKDFQNEEFLLLKQGNDMRNRSALLFSEAGIEPKVRIYLDQLITSYNLAASGMGIAFTTDALVLGARGQNLIYYRLDGPCARRRMYIGYKRNHYLSHACSAFIETALHVYGKEEA